MPLLKIETDGTRQSEGQLATRIQAFGETGLGLVSEEKNIPQNGGGYTAGIDSGSASTDAVILGPDGTIAGWSVTPTGAGAAKGAEKSLSGGAGPGGRLQREDCRDCVYRLRKGKYRPGR